MNILDQLFYTVKDSIGVLDNVAMGEKLMQLNAVNQMSFPKWIADYYVKPVPIIESAIVDTFTIYIPSLIYSIIDIHEIESFVKYVKIIIMIDLIGLRQFVEILITRKKINTLMFHNFSSSNVEASQKLSALTGKKNCAVYSNNDLVVTTANSIYHLRKEFQIHVYDHELFVAQSFGQIL